MKRIVIDNEEARQNALRNLHLLDTPPSESFDRITRMASRLLGVPVSTISLTDGDRQWFKSRVGVEVDQIPREEAPCHYAIRADKVFVVPDMLEDPRFSGSALARSGIRFYAGAPLITRSGYGLGTICVVDDKPRVMSDEEERVLIDLAAMVMTQIEVQNTIGRVDATSGHANEHQFFEDLEDLGKRAPDDRRIGVLVELVPPEQVSPGLRVLGAAYAEEMVRNSTETIRHAIGNGTRLYHVASTRCLVLLEGASAERLDVIAADLDARLRSPISCVGIPVTPDPVIGVYEFRVGAVRPRDVLRRLFSAADDARHSGRPVSSYNESRDQAHARSFQLLGEIRTALSEKTQLSLVYQPRVEVATGRYVGAEALLRWTHPFLGNVSPGEFIPLVEGTALARPLTERVVEMVAERLAAWGADRPPGTISINASARNLEESDFADRVGTILARHGLAPDAIELEFTENALVGDSPRVLGQLDALRRMGITIAIDDFGTGYSSLAYLQNIPASVLKIDQSFIKSLATREHDRTVVRAVIAMAHDLGFRVVAEGVETQDAYDLLAGWQCDEAQGYHIARPLPPEELLRWPGMRGTASH